jgi:DeoR/GlpR family transcriptional regulator of sugar metabolism
MMAFERKTSTNGQGMLPESRRRAIAERLRARGEESVADLETEFQVSSMTIRRDLRMLERQGLAKRTHGGAVAPGLAAHEDSFSQRLNVDVEVKQRLAIAAAALVEPGETVFIDSSSSAYYVARQMIANGIPASIVTNSLPVMQLFAAAVPSVELTGVGGWLRGLTLSLVGPAAVHAIRQHFADKLFLSVKGLTKDGSLTDPDPLECEVKRAMIDRAEESVLLLQAGKLLSRGSHLIGSCSELSLVLAAELSPHQFKQLEGTGVKVRRVD